MIIPSTSSTSAPYSLHSSTNGGFTLSQEHFRGVPHLAAYAASALAGISAADGMSGGGARYFSARLIAADWPRAP